MSRFYLLLKSNSAGSTNWEFYMLCQEETSLVLQCPADSPKSQICYIPVLLWKRVLVSSSHILKTARAKHSNVSPFDCK